MATLSTTLSGASNNKYTYQGGSYGIPKVSNPYAKLGSSLGLSKSGGGNQNFYAQLLQSQQQMGAQKPSFQFSAQHNFDPVLAKLNALGEMSIENARAEAAAARKQALIDAGTVDIARETGADENTITAAQNNPFSTVANLKKDFGDRQRQLDEALNQQGLFYSGQRIRDMEELERGRAEAETGFGGNLRNLLKAISDSLLAAEEEEKLRQIEAQLNSPLGAYGGGFGGFGGGAGAAPPPPVDPGVDPLGGAGSLMGVNEGLAPLLEDPYRPYRGNPWRAI